MIAVYENGTQQVTLKWHHQQSLVTGYVVQRSKNEIQRIDLDKFQYLEPSNTNLSAFWITTPARAKIFTALKFYLVKAP